ncbi:MAG: mobile mystery protein A [Burkholderiales bacterium]|nr:mobile mystery protein A [Burkholderiales bacterium]
MDTRDLHLTQLDQALAPWRELAGPPPVEGWLRDVRMALGISTRQAAQRAGVSQSTWVDAEQREAAGTISLGQLRRLGAALDCRLVHALVPDMPLRDKVEARAQKLAEAEVHAVAHSMALEQQRADDAYTRLQVEQRKQELLRGRRSRLWE